MLSPRGQRQIFDLSLGVMQFVLVLMKIVLVASLSVIEITSFTLRSSLVGNCC